MRWNFTLGASMVCALVACGTPETASPALAQPGADRAAPDRSARPRAPSAPSTPRSAARVFYLGHSLVGWHLPTMVDGLADHAGVTHDYAASIGNGAPLRWLWEHPETAEGTNAQTSLPSSAVDVLVLTEAIPLAEHVRWNDSAGFAGRFLELARRANPDVQVYLYETWHSRNEPGWRARLDTDRAAWASIVDRISAEHEGRDVLMIPAGRAMAALHDRIAAGGVPGITSIDALFHDDIHLSTTGWYFVSLVHFATIYRRSPAGLSARTIDRFGRPHAPPPAEAVPVLQEIAWDVVRRDPRSGVR